MAAETKSPRSTGPKDEAGAFSDEAHLAKAKRYLNEMGANDANDWRHYVWSSLALEHLSRAALARFSPVLLADERNWNHLLVALGIPPVDKNYNPRTISTSEVLKRLSALVPPFREVVGFCLSHADNRNSELHSGVEAFSAAQEAFWHAAFYRSCEILLDSMGRPLESIFSPEQAHVARAIIDASRDKAANQVLDDVERHRSAWLALSAEEREEASKRAWLSTEYADCLDVECPACQSKACLSGEACAPSRDKFDFSIDTILQSQEYLPSRFDCAACKLQIFGLPKLTAIGLGDRYVKQDAYDAWALFGEEAVFEPHARPDEEASRR